VKKSRIVHRRRESLRGTRPDTSGRRRRGVGILIFWSEAALASAALGGIYALTAFGFVIIYRATRVFNFAQGVMMALGAYFLYVTSVTLDLPFWPALLCACVVSAALGTVIYFLFMRPMNTHPIFATIIVTMGVSIFLAGVIGVIWGASDRYITLPITGVQNWGEVPISNYSLTVIGISLGVCFALMLFFKYSRTGLQMRATAENNLLASQRGISSNRILAVTWLLAGLTAGLAGMLYAANTSVSPSISDLGLSAFPAALLGGFESIGGALIGGMIIGTAQTVASLEWGAEASTVVSFVILLVIMLIRPSGFFGKPESIQRV
jgi:branched-chain amino acid transport system permease protein